ncbi:MAG: transglutaminase family protein [Dokdonella sp.]|nr:transglutaminase family protein [Dokdonella sp.]MCB1571573.1 transglutaminase family protein [Xanthomonadales bacterium]MCB1572851.1 transglutaminase family protein [Xanthomonadales bacterium]MCB1578205.1 transglutaminase family protein [Xanthomonadales bacterium]
MHLSIQHRTVYRYAEPALRVTQALRLWPAACTGQRVIGWQVDVDGKALPYATTDGFGNPVATHTADGAVDQVRIDVQGHVETEDLHGVVGGTLERLPVRFFLFETPLTHVDESIRELAGQVPSINDAIERMHRLCNHVRDRLDYVAGETDSATTAAEALANGSGVCQDHAHLMAASARVLGFPARYVSGYLCAGVEGAEAASHAWAEIHIADFGWVGFDAANRICPNEHYVRIACGRDYHDAAPVRGVHRGGRSETLEVSVSISETPAMPTRGGSPGNRGQSAQQ